MYQNVITIFNFHESSGKWYPAVIRNTDLLVNKSSGSTTSGKNNADTVELIIRCSADKRITTANGIKSYTGPKEYAKCNTPAEYITFKPECDFIYDGEWPELVPISDDGYDSGLYHALNDEYDGIYMITSASFYGLLPHFEIGGR